MSHESSKLYCCALSCPCQFWDVRYGICFLVFPSLGFPTSQMDTVMGWGYFVKIKYIPMYERLRTDLADIGAVTPSTVVTNSTPSPLPGLHSSSRWATPGWRGAGSDCTRNRPVSGHPAVRTISTWVNPLISHLLGSVLLNTFVMSRTWNNFILLWQLWNIPST